MVDNYAQLVAEAQSRINTMLENEVGAYVKSVLRQHIVSDIYNAYHPKSMGWVSPVRTATGAWQPATYQRRYSLLQHITGYLTAPGELFVTSTAYKSSSIYGSASYTSYDGDFLRLLEGTPGRFNNGLGVWQGGFGRPAVTNTQQEINKNKRPIIQRALASYF